MDFPRRVLPDGRTLEVVPLTYGRGRLCITIKPEDVGTSFDDLW
jgi:hypothetical protein